MINFRAYLFFFFGCWSAKDPKATYSTLDKLDGLR